MTVAKQQLQYQFHNPNTVEDTADFLLHLFVEVNRPKADRAVQSGLQASYITETDRQSAGEAVT